MKKYIFKRLIISVVTIWLLTTVSFFLLRTLPGNPFTSTKVLSEQMQEQLKHYYGLDRPLIEQYFTYMKNLLHGDFGYSLKYTNRSVNSIISDSFPISADLGLRALVISYPIGIFLGVISARKRGQAVDYMCVLFAVIGVSIPSFVLGTMLQWIFGVKLGVLPTAQWKSFAHTILPTIAMALTHVASTTRSMRASMLEITSQDYVKTAKAKGLSNREIVMRHQIRNALVPIITGLGSTIASTLMGSFVIEQIFSIPGLGRYFVQSVQNLDYTMTLGLTIFFGCILVSANLIIDILYGFIDPRITVTK